MFSFDRLRELEKKRFFQDRKGQMPIMDAETLRELCLDNDGYETPELNDNLYAHFRGFQRIEGLERYCNLKALWLESNGLSKIENLECLTNLRCLYLNKNLIEKIENLSTLRELNTLDLSENRIQSLDGLAQLPNLLSLNAARNCLTTSADLQELAQCPLLDNIDISHNLIEDPEILDVITRVPMLKALRMTGNPVVSSTRSFRKTYIAALPHLAFLDRPIFPIERASVAAWQSGGIEAEREAKRIFVNKENEERRSSLRDFRDWQAQVRERRIEELEHEREQKTHEVAPESNQKDFDVDLQDFQTISKKECAAMYGKNPKGDARIEEEMQSTSKEAMLSALPQSTQTTAVTLHPHTSLQFENEKGDARCPNVDQKLLKAPEAMVEATDSKSPIVLRANISAADVKNPDPRVSIVQRVENISLIEDQAARDIDSVSEMTSICEGGAEMTVARMDKDAATAIAGGRSKDGGRHNTHTIVSLPTDASSGQPTLPPPPPMTMLHSVRSGPVVFEPRETWAQLQQRASAAPCQLRPHPLPSAFEVRYFILHTTLADIIAKHWVAGSLRITI